MKQIKLLILVLLVGGLNAQQIEEPNYGLAMSAAGMSVFAFGATLKPTLVVQQYNPRYGHNYVRYDSVDRQRIKSSTLLVGAAFTLVGIYLQNKKRIKRSQSAIKI
tara:strand:- start:485 stop:802 length:318 start_codon:yes stop_codon:yes gene_type:complete